MADAAPHQTPAETPERKAFYQKIDGQNLRPLWTVMRGMVTPEPQSPCVPHVWHFDEIRKAMEEAGGLITAKEAERRVLILENPGLRGQNRVTTSLFAGIQMVLPGEVAPAHRHAQSALRFVLKGQGAHTAVDGEKTIMHEGDFVITPSMTWHDHGNDSSEPMLWLDGLDIPVVQLLDASFFEDHESDEHILSRPQGDAMARYGHNLLPVDAPRVADGATSPIFNYPYEHSRTALEKLKSTSDWDPCHGIKMRYIDPRTGESAMPTIGTFLQLMPKGFRSARYRSTDGTVFACVEGRGRTKVDGMILEWGPRDVFVVPSWRWVEHETDAETVLFSYSDRPIQQKLGLFREDRGNR